MKSFHLKFEAHGIVRYVPAYKAEVVIGKETSTINSHVVPQSQAESAASSFERADALPALGVWDCTKPDGGV